PIVPVPIQDKLKGSTDAFVTRFRPGNTTADYSTYLGGTADEEGAGIALFGQDAYVVGSTTSADFPFTSGVVQTDLLGSPDAFVARLKDAGSRLVFATFYGGKALEAGTGIAVDGSGDAYFTGSTTSTDFPLVAAAQPQPGGDTDAFVAKIRGDGSRIVYSTYLGGKLADFGRGIAVDTLGAAHVTGETNSGDFPLVDDITFPGMPGLQDVFVTKLAPPGCALIHSRVFGSSDHDFAGGIAISGTGNNVFEFIAGTTQTTVNNFPIVDPPPPGGLAQPSYGGGTADAFASQIASNPMARLDLNKVDSPDPVLRGGILTYTLSAKNTGPDGTYDIVVTDNLPAGVTYVSGTVLAPA